MIEIHADALEWHAERVMQIGRHPEQQYVNPKLLQKCATTIAQTARSRAIAAHGTRIARGSAVRIDTNQCQLGYGCARRSLGPIGGECTTILRPTPSRARLRCKTARAIRTP